jgi:uroporphyrinogen-III synthase
MLFINTRPTERAQPLTECLRQSGFTVVDLPLLELKPRPYDSTLAALYSALLSTQIIVVVSPMAVEMGMKYLQQSGLTLAQIEHIQWIAVGKKTAQHLAEFGIHSHVPEVESSEGMLSLPLFNTLTNIKQIAFWRGEGGRQFMMQQCKERHINVLNFILYERICPSETQTGFLNMLAEIERYKPPYWNCISSEASWRNWLALTQNHPDLLDACHYLVLGERLYQLLMHDKNTTQKCFNITQILTLEPEAILHRIVQLQRKL